MRINVLLTCVEITGLVLIIVIGATALAGGHGDPGRALEFKAGTSVLPVFLAGTVLAFYALIGFDDSVNVAEETQDRAGTTRALSSGRCYSRAWSTSSSPSPPAW